MIQIFPGHATWYVSYPYCAEPSCRKAKKSCGQFSRKSASKLKNGCFWHCYYLLTNQTDFIGPCLPAVQKGPFRPQRITTESRLLGRLVDYRLRGVGEETGFDWISIVGPNGCKKDQKGTNFIEF